MDSRTMKIFTATLIDGMIETFDHNGDLDVFELVVKLQPLYAEHAEEWARLCTAWDICPVHVTDIGICMDDELPCVTGRDA